MDKNQNGQKSDEYYKLTSYQSFNEQFHEKITRKVILEFPNRITSTLSSDKLQKENIQKEMNKLEKK